MREKVRAFEIPDAKRKHTPEIIDHSLAFFLVKVQQHLRVGLAMKRASLGFECGTQLSVIVDLPIKGHDEATVCARHRLGAAFRKVEDRQPAMAQTHPLVVRIPLPEAVGSPESHMITNAPHLGAINRVGGIMIRVDTGDSAHPAV